MKQICQDCHFLSKEAREENTGRALCFSLSQSDRSDVEGVADHYSLKCWMGVWDEGVAPHPVSRTVTIAGTHRKGWCFFFPHRSNMRFPAAREMQKRQEEHEQMKRSNLYTRYGLYIAAIALFFGAFVRLVLNCQ